jgi:hypothetical protein
MSTQRTQAPESADNAHNRAAAIDPLENSIGAKPPSGICALEFRFPPTCAAAGDTWKDRIGLNRAVHRVRTIVRNGSIIPVPIRRGRISAVCRVVARRHVAAAEKR